MRLVRNFPLLGATAFVFSIAALTAPALAATYTATGTLTVQAQVVAACTVGDQTLDFGTYFQNEGSPLDQSANISVTCSVPFVVAMSAGNATSDTARYMKSTGTPADQLNYNLYTASTYTSAYIWSDTTTCGTIGSGGTNCINEDGTATPYTIPVYGQIPASQASNVHADYTDTVTMTVTY